MGILIGKHESIVYDDGVINLLSNRQEKLQSKLCHALFIRQETIYYSMVLAI